MGDGEGIKPAPPREWLIARSDQGAPLVNHQTTYRLIDLTTGGEISRRSSFSRHKHMNMVQNVMPIPLASRFHLPYQV